MTTSRGQWPPELTCSAPSCRNKRLGGAELCERHVLAQRAERCSLDGCGRPRYCRGWCRAHYYRWRRTGDVRAVEDLQDQSAYGTGRSVHGGYVLLHRPDHPDADSRGRIPEHRLVMGEVLGRRLGPGENVHHVNGDRLDNRPSNLELWLVRQPRGQRVEDLVDWAAELLARYAPTRLASH